MSEEALESPYCDVCGTCGYIDCCGIRNFIDEHIKGKTNCKNEDGIIADIINLCEYKDKVFEDNDNLKKEIERLSKEVTKYDEILCERNNEVDRLNNIINELEKRLEEEIKEERPKDHLWLMGYYDASKDYLIRLKELKGSDE